MLNQVTVRFGADRPREDGDRLTIETIAEIQRDGTCFAGGAFWQGLQTMRISVIGGTTSEADANRSADAMIAAWRRVRGN